MAKKNRKMKHRRNKSTSPESIIELQQQPQQPHVMPPDLIETTTTTWYDWFQSFFYQ